MAKQLLVICALGWATTAEAGSIRYQFAYEGLPVLTVVVTDQAGGVWVEVDPMSPWDLEWVEFLAKDGGEPWRHESGYSGFHPGWALDLFSLTAWARLTRDCPPCMEGVEGPEGPEPPVPPAPCAILVTTTGEPVGEPPLLLLLALASLRWWKPMRLWGDQ